MPVRQPSESSVLSDEAPRQTYKRASNVPCSSSDPAPLPRVCNPAAINHALSLCCPRRGALRAQCLLRDRALDSFCTNPKVVSTFYTGQNNDVRVEHTACDEVKNIKSLEARQTLNDCGAPCEIGFISARETYH